MGNKNSGSARLNGAGDEVVVVEGSGVSRKSFKGKSSNSNPTTGKSVIRYVRPIEETETTDFGGGRRAKSAEVSCCFKWKHRFLSHSTRIFFCTYFFSLLGSAVGHACDYFMQLCFLYI